MKKAATLQKNRGSGPPGTAEFGLFTADIDTPSACHPSITLP
jgi:hypothetical protein